MGVADDLELDVLVEAHDEDEPCARSRSMLP